MDYRVFFFLGAAFLGALLGIAFRVRTIIIGVAIIFGMSIAAIGIAYEIGGDNAGLVFGLVSMAIPVLGLVMVAAAGVVRAARRPRDDEWRPRGD
jgi:hypothetical protein